MSLRIVHFLSCTGHGGDARAALGLGFGQRQLGHDVRLLIGASPCAETLLVQARRLGVPAEEIRGLPLSDRIPLPLRVRRLKAAVERLTPDVLHLHTGELSMRAADVMGARLAKARLRVATVHSPYPWRENTFRAQMSWRMLAPLLDHVICPSSVARSCQLAAGLDPRRVTALPNAVDVAGMRAGNGDRIRAEFRLTEEQQIILFLARLDGQKRPLDALAAFQAISLGHPRAVMLIVGTGDQEERCRQYAAEAGLAGRVLFAGYRHDVADLMKAADVYVLPTECESFGLTVVEALSAGAAVVTTDIRPLRDEVAAADCALFTPVGDISALREAVELLLRDEKRRNAMRRAGQDMVERRFSAAAVASAHLDLYEACGRRLSAAMRDRVTA